MRNIPRLTKPGQAQRPRQPDRPSNNQRPQRPRWNDIKDRVNDQERELDQHLSFLQLSFRLSAVEKYCGGEQPDDNPLNQLKKTREELCNLFGQTYNKIFDLWNTYLDAESDDRPTPASPKVEGGEEPDPDPDDPDMPTDD